MKPRKFKKGKYQDKDYREVIKKDPEYIAFLIEEHGDDFERLVMDYAGELYRVYFRRLVEKKGAKISAKFPRSMALITEESVLLQILRKLNAIEAMLVEILDEREGSTSKRSSRGNRKS